MPTALRAPLDGADHAELARKLDFLRRADAYPEPTHAVESIETHLSCVFLTDRHAYKLKKPVRLDYLDYSSTESRRRHCESEVLLNRRLANEVYLGVAPLTICADRFAIGALEPLLAPPLQSETNRAAQPIVDWLVVMRRLPRANMLDQRIQRGTVRAGELGPVLELLVDFYSCSDRAGLGDSEYLARLERDVLRYRDELGAPRFDLDGLRLNTLTALQLDVLRHEPALLAGRAARVVDAHGDLRPEHVLLETKPVVIDCLEFDRELRWLDPASELSFLALECEQLGAPSVGELILSRYSALSGDRPPRRLLDFYRAHHAMIRATLALWHLDDPTVDEHSKWAKKARTYLRLAARAAGTPDAEALDSGT